MVIYHNICTMTCVVEMESLLKEWTEIQRLTSVDIVCARLLGHQFSRRLLMATLHESGWSVLIGGFVLDYT